MTVIFTPRENEVVYQFDVSEDQWQALTETQRDLVNTWVEVHGVSRMAMLIGTAIYVRFRNGQLWFETWRAVGDDSRTAETCPTCPTCIKQEPVSVPLAAPVPPWGYVNAAARATVGLRVAEAPDVPEAELVEALKNARRRATFRSRADAINIHRLEEALRAARPPVAA